MRAMASGIGAPDGDGPRREPPTIDVMATPGAHEPRAADAARLQPPTGQTAPAPAQPGDAPTSRLRPVADASGPSPAPPEPTGPPPEQPPARDTSKSWLPSNPPWTLAGAGTVGGACVLLVLGGLWLAGASSRREEAARLAQLESQVGELGARPAPAQVSRVEELGARLGRSETAL